MKILLTFNKKAKITFMNMIIFINCFFSALYLIYNTTHEGYALLFTQPIVYCLVFILVLGRRLFNIRNNLFFVIFTGVSFIRYVLLPILVVYSSYYDGQHSFPPSNDSYFLAVILMNLELILVSIFIQILSERRNYKTELKFKIGYKYNNNDGYYLFIATTFLLVLIFPNVLTQMNFIIPTSLNYSLELTTIDNIILYCVIVSKQLLYVIIIKKLKYRYSKNNDELWLLVSVIISLINISLYFGVNRMDIVINAIVTLYILKKIYGSKIYKFFLILIPIIIILFRIVTADRNYVSYSDDSAVNFATTLQAYTGGVYNVAIAIETIDFYPQVRNLKVFLMDIFRPMIGPNILVKNLDVPYSNIFFNRRIQPNSEVVSQIIPMVGQGYIYFGAIFSSTLSLFFIKIQDYLEKILNETYSLEVFYFVSLSSARLGMLMGNNTMNLINDLSMNLVLFFIVFLFNKYFSFLPKRKSGKINEEII